MKNWFWVPTIIVNPANSVPLNSILSKNSDDSCQARIDFLTKVPLNS